MDPPQNNEPNEEIDISIDDYEVDSVLVVLPSKKQKTSNSPESQASQVAPIEAVKYDYIFKKLLTGTDVNNQMNVPLREAEKHFPRIEIQDALKRTVVCVYDIDRQQKREWELSRNYRLYTFTVNWKVYVNDNQLQVGDSVLFYKTARDRIINSGLPLYAVKFKKAGETIDMGTLYIPFDKLAEKRGDSNDGLGGSTSSQVRIC